MNIGESQPNPFRQLFGLPEVKPHHHHHHHEHEAPQPQGDRCDLPGNDWEQHAHGLGNLEVPLPPVSNDAFVKGLYHQLLGREPDLEGYHAHMKALEQGATHEQLVKAFMSSPEYQALQASKVAPGAAPPAAPVAVADLPPITIDTVKDAARQYIAQHPEIANEPSYENRAAVAQLREGVIAMLSAKGYKVGRILGPDGQPYDQMIAFGNPNDPKAQAYRVTAGGGPIHEAITVGYTNDPIPWSDVH
jgi:hypothetical protein